MSWFNRDKRSTARERADQRIASLNETTDQRIGRERADAERRGTIFKLESDVVFNRALARDALVGAEFHEGQAAYLRALAPQLNTEADEAEKKLRTLREQGE